MKKAIIEASFGTSYTNALDNSVLALQKRFKEDFADYDVFTVIKKENIGLIEVMGLAVLPARLAKEINMLETAMLNGENLNAYPELIQHAQWAEDILKRHPDFNKDNAKSIIEDEIGKAFLEVLEDAGVFKRNENGQKAFKEFITSINEYVESRHANA